MQQDYFDQDYSEEHVENPSVFAELLNSPLAMTPASTGQRFINYVVDIITFYVLLFGVGIFLGLVSMLTDSETLVNSLDGPFAPFFGILVMLSYYFVMESLTGRTVGKLLTRTRVVMEDGSKLTATAAFQRTLSRIIPFEAFSFFGGGPGLHDRLATTRVVKVD